MRLVIGPDHRVLLPASMMAGGILLLFSDTLARTAGNEIPVGVVTAFFGAPFFILLLKRRYRQ
jgi:iron complex transport system permease protein